MPVLRKVLVEFLFCTPIFDENQIIIEVKNVGRVYPE
jgi:hypothetical protein